MAMDIKQMIDSVPLIECKKEIDNLFASVANHENRMKRAVLLCFFGEAVLGEIAKEDSDRFVNELRDFLNKIANENTENGKRLMAHIRENGEIIKNIDTISDELRDISTQMTGLMTDYDNRLAEVIRTRDKLSIGKL